MTTTTKPSMAMRLGAWLIAAKQKLSSCICRLSQSRLGGHVANILRDKRKRLLIGLPIALFIVVLLAVLLALPSSHDAATQARAVAVVHDTDNAINASESITLPKRLDNLAVQLQRINTTLSSNGAVTNIDNVRQSVAALSQKMTALAAESQALVTKAVTDATAPMQQQLQRISVQLQSLQKKDAQNTVVSAAHLPFTVVQIDNIQQTNVVTLTYNHQTFPIDVGDNVAGWKLAAADFAEQTARFVNRKHQMVKLALNRVGGAA